MKIDNFHYNKLGLLDLIKPRNMTCINTSKTKRPMKRRMIIFWGRLTIDEMIVRKVIDNAGIMTAISM